jgi:hypothetical protein
VRTDSAGAGSGTISSGRRDGLLGENPEGVETVSQTGPATAIDLEVAGGHDRSPRRLRQAADPAIGPKDPGTAVGAVVASGHGAIPWRRAGRRDEGRAVHFAIDTDSHAVIHLANTRFGVTTAQRAWIGTAEVINYRPLAELRGFLKKAPLRRAVQR